MFQVTLMICNLTCTLLLAYQLLFVYICKRGKRFCPCCQDLRLWILLISMANGVIVTLSHLQIIDNIVIKGIVVPEILRYTVLFLICLMYSSAASKNLISNRRFMHWIVIAFFLLSSILMIHYGIDISEKHMYVQDYNKIVCMDPLMIKLRLPPIFMSLFFCGLVFHISKILKRLSEQYDDELGRSKIQDFEIKRRERRYLTLYSLRIVVTTFFLVNFYLLCWELTQYILNSYREPG